MADLFEILDRCPFTSECAAGERWGIFEPRVANLMAYCDPIGDGDWGRKNNLHAVLRSDYDVKFSPLDHNRFYSCNNPNGESVCDAFIYGEKRKVAVFVELKNRKDKNKNLDEIAVACVETNALSELSAEDKSEWLPKSVIQLKKTLERFKESNPDEYQMYPAIHDAYVVNQKLGYNVEYSAEGAKAAFKENTGFNLKINTLISIDALPRQIKLRLLDDNTLAEITA